MEDVLAKTILTELIDFRKENSRKWQQSNNQRKKDRKELFEILNTINKSITKQFDYIEKCIDSGHDKILEN